jgi:hypothetical protein
MTLETFFFTIEEVFTTTSTTPVASFTAPLTGINATSRTPPPKPLKGSPGFNVE